MAHSKSVQANMRVRKAHNTGLYLLITPGVIAWGYQPDISTLAFLRVQNPDYFVGYLFT